MRIGVLRICFMILDAQSLKEKRMVLRSLKDRLAGRFNVAVAEIGSNEKWQIGELGVVTIGNDGKHVRGIVEQARQFLSTHPSVRVIESDIELI